MRNLLLIFLLFISSLTLYADSLLVSPVSLPLNLSANFGELRPNHFHAGLDIKTMQRTGLPIVSVDSGYVSRIKLSPCGYGHCVYVDHSQLGLTTVYAHLLSLSGQLHDIVKAEQYRTESFEVDMHFKPNEIKLKRGERIALSGNTGSSGGPHLHFETRILETQEPVDGLRFYDVNDTMKPRIKKISLMPLSADALVQGKYSKHYDNTVAINTGNYKLSKGKIKAWGKLGLAVKAFDYMNGQNNFYGFKSMQVYVDSALIFNYQIDKFSYDETRYINALIDYKEKMHNKKTYMCAYRLPNNNLRVYNNLVNDGYIFINQEKDYNIKVVVADYYKNTSILNFVIQGVRNDKLQVADSLPLFSYNQENSFVNDELEMVIPASSLYQDINFDYSILNDSNAISSTHTIHNNSIPMHNYGSLKVKLNNDTLIDKSKYYLAYSNGKNGWWRTSGSYVNGYMVNSYFIDFGKYKVAIDKQKPVIKLIYTKNGILRFKLEDSKTGVKSFKVTIDGNWALFEQTCNGYIRYQADPEKIKRGKTHKVVVTAVDYCGNEATRSINWYY